MSTNLVVLDQAGEVVKAIYTKTQARPVEVVDAGLAEIRDEIGDRIRVLGVGTTGSGRELVGELCGADLITDEITAHKTGADFISRSMHAVDTIFEIGGQDSKFISMHNGMVVDFTMNEACAAGTGSFLEEQAEKLGISIKEEFARAGAGVHRPARLGERCTVFMERDVTGSDAQGRGSGRPGGGPRVLGGLNYLNRVVRGRKIGKVHLLPGRHGLQRRRGRGVFADPRQADHRAAAQRRDGRHRHGADRPRPHEGRPAQPSRFRG